MSLQCISHNRLAACPRHFSMIAVCGKETYFPLSRLRTQLPSATIYAIVHHLHNVLYDIIKQHMDISVRKPNSTQRSGTDVFVDDALSAKDARYFRSPCPIIQISSYTYIENTLKCPCLNRSSRGTPQIRCASSLYSHRIWQPLVVRGSMRQQMVIGCLY